jgi:hypothetical protein
MEWNKQNTYWKTPLCLGEGKCYPICMFNVKPKSFFLATRRIDKHNASQTIPHCSEGKGNFESENMLLKSTY